MANKGKNNGKREASLPPEGDYSENGAGSPSDIDERVGLAPGQSDVFLGFQKGPANLVREMLTWSDDPAEFLPRTEVSEDEIRRHMRIMATQYAIYYGFTNVPALLRDKYGLRVSLGRKGREEAVRMITFDQMRNQKMNKGQVSKFKDFNRDEVMQ